MAEVTLTVNGGNYGGWKNVRVTKSMETLSGGFDLEVSERWPGQDVDRAIKRGDECTLRLDDDVVVTGWVDDVNVSIDAETHTLQVTGRDKAGDLVDCSAIHKPGQWSGRKMEEIVQWYSKKP